MKLAFISKIAITIRGKPLNLLVVRSNSSICIKIFAVANYSIGTNIDRGKWLKRKYEGICVGSGAGVAWLGSEMQYNTALRYIFGAWRINSL